MPFGQSVQTMGQIMGRRRDADPNALIASGVFRGLTPEEKRNAIWEGLMSGNRYLGGVVRAADTARDQRTIAPFAEMLGQAEADPSISPERKIELARDRVKTMLGVPTYQRDEPRRPFFQTRETMKGDVPMQQTFGAIGREYPESFQGPDWFPLSDATPKYKKSMRDANKERDITKRETAAGFAKYLGSLPREQARDIVGQASGADTMTAPSQAWLALIAEYPELAAKYTKGTAPGAEPYSPGGVEGQADDPASWESFRKRHPHVPEFGSTSPALRRLYLEQFQE